MTLSVSLNNTGFIVDRKQIPAISAEELELYIKIQLLSVCQVCWKSLGESIRKQGRESTRVHKIRLEKHRQIEALRRSFEVFQLRQVQAFRFYPVSLETIHLAFPV